MSFSKLAPRLFILAAAGALVAGVWLGSRSHSSTTTKAPEIFGTLLTVAKPLTQFALIDQSQHIFTEQNLRGNWSLIFMGYTHCPDICPTTLTTLQQTVELMQSQSLLIPNIIFISVDPERDTTDVLGKYVGYFNKDFLGVTGTAAEIKNISQQTGVYYSKAAGRSGNINKPDYLMDHSAAILLINPQAELQAYLTAPHTPQHIIESLITSKQFYESHL